MTTITEPRIDVPPLEIGLKVRAGDAFRDLVSKAGIRVFAVMGEPLAKLMTRGVQRDPYPAYAQFRERGLFRGKRIPLWVCATHDLVYRVTRDPRFGVDNRVLKEYSPPSHAPGDPMVDVPGDGEMMLRMDPPDHTRVRKLVSRAFTPRAIESWRPQVQRVADDLVDAVATRGSMDLVADYARLLPILVICEILGIPSSDRDRFHHWGDDVVKTLAMNVSRADMRRSEHAALCLTRYFEQLFASRRSEPRDDVVSALMAAEEEGDRLSHREMVATCMLLLLAGFETTVNLISNGTAALLRNPDQLELLRADPSLAANAVEELLRYDSPVQFTSRNVMEDLELDGQSLERGTQVGVMLGAANRDSAVFEKPDVLDLRRHNANMNVAFSSGPHYCLGAALARLEGEVAFTTLLRRCRDLRPAGLAVRRKNELLRGYERMPLAFGAA